MPDPGSLQQAIAGLEGFRSTLGDRAVDAAIDSLRRHARSERLPAAPAEGTGAEPAEHGPRLRQVSILFADVADSTAMLGRVGPEDAQDLLGRALQGFADAVRAWDGEVLRFTGDGIKAAFGTRGLREDDAERAVRAGLRILEGATQHAERVARELGIAGFGVRVGIHTGPVLLGGGVEAERSAMGHAVHLAARMEQSAPVGRLRISDATWSQVRGLFRAEAQPPLRVKGHDEPLATWLVSGVESDPDAAVQRGVEGVATPMIGRDTELTQLVELHARAARERRALAVQVVGEAGVGKTRLRRELLARLDRGEGDISLLQARAHPSTPLQPYGLLRQLVMRWLGIDDDEPAASARARLVDGLAPWLGADAARQAARLGALMGLDFSAEPAVQALSASMLREQGFAALRHALHARARSAAEHGKALLLVLDDLHWADEASLDFVRTLLAPADVPLLLLLMARPALAERAVLEAAPGFELQALTLDSLGEANGQALLDALLAPLPMVPAMLRGLLLQRAAGNPFYLEALVRMLIDDGVIDARARPWVLHEQRLSALRVPATLVGVLQARLDALPAGELLALQQASIVGPVFWRAALQAVDPAAPEALPALERRTLVTVRATSAFARTDEHAFAHQLLHETTYGTVLKEQRREGHARAARWLAARISDRAGEFLAITAEHYERAGDSAMALEFWDQAQLDAMRRFASHAAIAFIERALAQPALTDPRWRYNLLNNRYTLLDRVGLAEPAAAAQAALAAWAESQDDDAMRACALQAEMLRADHEGRPGEAKAIARRVIELAARAPGTFASPAAALAHGELAWLAVGEHDHDEAARQVTAGIRHARDAARTPKRYGGYPGYEQQLRAIAISSLAEQERPMAALDAVREARAALDAQATPYDHWNLLECEFLALRMLGRHDEAAECAERMVQGAQQLGVARLLPAAHVSRASVALRRGRLDRAENDLIECERLAAATDGGFMLPAVRALQGGLAHARGDDALAQRHWADAVERYTAQGRTRSAYPTRARLALLDLRAGRSEAAREAVDALLAEIAPDPRPDRRALPPEALFDCHRVLTALGDPRAEGLLQALRVRLDEQLQAIGDEALRRVLVTEVPHWHEVAMLLGRGSTALSALAGSEVAAPSRPAS